MTLFEGVITGRAQYLTGCDQYALAPQGNPNNLTTQWFDEGRIEVIGEGISATSVQVERNGGPNRDAPR